MMRKKDKASLLTYDTQIAKKRLTLIIAFAGILAMALYAIASGSINLGIDVVVKTLFGGGDAGSDLVVFGIRLPRVITAMLVGALLAVTGAVMQCVLNNPLASASTLGVSQGAAFGAAVGIIVFGGGVVNSGATSVAIAVENPYIVTLSAFVFGSISTAVIILLSQLKRNIGPAGLILAGVALSSLFGGGTALLQYFADDTKISAVVFWTFGNLGSTSWKEILILTVIFVVTFLYFLLNRWNYNAMRAGADTAKSLGVNARAVMLVSLGISSFAAAIAVSFVGVISFIGLIAPHIMRIFVGDDYRFLIPASALAGALVLLAADTFARLIIAPVILPVGAITAFLGAPVFLALLLKGGDRY